jgi:hypothetical protein
MLMPFFQSSGAGFGFGLLRGGGWLRLARGRVGWGCLSRACLILTPRQLLALT